MFIKLFLEVFVCLFHFGLFKVIERENQEKTGKLKGTNTKSEWKWSWKARPLQQTPSSWFCFICLFRLKNI